MEENTREKNYKVGFWSSVVYVLVLMILVIEFRVQNEKLNKQLMQYQQFEAQQNEFNEEGLKPCPFCGSTDVYVTDWRIFDNWDKCDNYGTNYKEVTCHNCQANTFTNYDSDDERDPVDKWNNRIGGN